MTKLEAPLRRCPDCSNLTDQPLAVCQACHQRLTVYLELPEGLVYWGRSYSPLAIQANRTQRLASRVVDSFLIVLAAAGAVAGAIHVAANWADGPVLFRGPSVAQLWIGVLAACLVVSRRGWRHRERATVLSRSFDGAVAPTSRPRWVDASVCASTEVLASLEAAAGVAVADSGSDIQPLHLLIGLLRQPGVAATVARLGVPSRALADQVQGLALKDSSVVHGGSRALTPESLEAILGAYWLAYRDRRPRLEAADVLLGVATADERVRQILFDVGITSQKLTNAAAWLRINNQLAHQYRRLAAGARLKPKGVMNRAMTAVATPTLDMFSHDLTQLARVGILTLAVAREREVGEVLRLLESSRPVLLVGNDGVGKTSIIQALAGAMAAETVPAKLQDKRLVALSLPALLAGGGAAGAVEQRILAVFDEARRAGNVILAVEGLHNVTGIASGGEESINLAEVFAEGLGDGTVLAIATATPQQRSQFLDQSALGALFEPVLVAEPDDDSCLQMLAAHVGVAEARQGVAFTYDALERCVELSRRYVREVSLPAQAIRLMEEAAVFARRRHASRPIVTPDDVGAVVAAKTGVPVTSVTEAEENKLQRLEEEIHNRMVGQTEAVTLVSQALRRARTNLRDPKRPIASFLFLGPTGVGKTELARTIAEVYFGAEQRMVRLDMSEYQLVASLPQLLGTPDGNQPGALTEAVRRRPFCLLLLDELEKAHPDILNIFLQVMEDGRLTDAQGRTVDFTNVIIIATSNAGTTYIQDQVRAGAPLVRIKTALVQEQLRGIFKPEFINRFDAVVVFAPLTLVEVNEIARRMVKGIAKRLEERGVFLRVTEEAIAEFAQRGFDPAFGARPLRRVLQDTVENTLANFLLAHKVDRRDVVVIKPGGVVEVEQAVREI